MTMENKEEHDTRDLNEIRRQLAGKKGKEYWRSLNEFADSEDFEKVIRQEFPRQAGLLDELNRRDFIKVLGASLALAGLTACAPQSSGKIYPYSKPPEEIIPGKSIYFASALLMDGYARGVLLETTMGRPIKVEGNPKHPGSMGATDPFMQAAILDLYNPDRIQQVTNKGAASTWKDFTAALGPAVGGGGGLRILSGPVTSPSLVAQINALLTKYPQAKWYQYSPLGHANSQAAANQAFGQAVDAVYNFANADVVLSLDCDFLFFEPGSLRYSRDFTQRHQPVSASGTMSRLYVVESSATLTGENADHRLSVKPSQVETFARAIAAKLGVNAGAPSGSAPGQDWLDPLAADLKKAGRAALVVAGERQPAAVHALAYAMNQALGSIGNTVNLIPTTIANPGNPNDALRALVQDLNGGGVDVLVIMDSNPVYTAPADIDFAAALKKAKTSVDLAYWPDETTAAVNWVVPAAHPMEMWGDALAFDGTFTLIQPVIDPIFGGKSPYELVAALAGQSDAKGYDLVRGFWQAQMKGGSFDQDWRDVLGRGIAPVTGAAPGSAGAPNLTVNAAALAGAAAAAPAAGALEIVFEPDYTIWDGSYYYNSWLQELPKPLTKLTWDNAAVFSPATARRLNLSDNDVVELKLRGRSVQAPVFIQPGQPDDVVVVSLGYGRKASETIPAGFGYNAYKIRTSQAPWFDTGVEVSKTGKTYELVTTHEHWSMENRDLIRSATAEEYQANPKFAQLQELQTPTLYGEDNYPGYAWGMSINLNTCIGCNACVVACQAENNIPTVGKDQVRRGREMHWLRIDRYYQGNPDKAKVIAFQPVPCMHCEKAPCEPVCPVEATSHSAEGINEMTYNRCVGTRYCSNNCPYKVRRFNFFKYNNFDSESLKAMRNPNVTVRMRGVMEKCTYCIQRINNGRIQAEVEGRTIQDGEVKTACQRACPTNAIVFGNINDTNSAVRKLKDLPLNYGLLDHLGTRPRTSYLGKVKNPNPNIKEQA